MTQIMKRIKCMRAGKYAVIPSDGDSIIDVKKGDIDSYPIEFAEAVLNTGSFVAVEKNGKPSIDPADLNRTLIVLEKREATLQKAKEAFAKEKADFEKAKELFAKKIEDFADDIDPDDDDIDPDDIDPDAEIDPDNDEDPAEKSVAELCDEIVKNSKNEEDAKTKLIEFADARVGLELNMRYSSKTMTERIIEADESETDGE